jgi:hypothetical protein
VGAEEDDDASHDQVPVVQALAGVGSEEAP